MISSLRLVAAVVLASSGVIAAPARAVAPENATSRMQKATCKSWSEARRGGGDPTNAALLETWAEGALSGAAMGADVDILASLDKGAIRVWFDGWCAKRPLESWSHAAEALLRELLDRAGYRLAEH